MSEKPQLPAVFLDRDGTICKEVDYLAHPDQVELLPSSAEAIARLNRAGVYVIVTTNQSGVARGYFTEDDVAAVHTRLRELLASQGAKLDAVYYCPHHPDKGFGHYRSTCDCRKPEIGMIRQAQRDWPIDLRNSYVVGDKLSDIEFGGRAGITSILVLTGYGEQERQKLTDGNLAQPDFIASDLKEAVEWILNDLFSKGVLEFDPKTLSNR